MAFLHQSDKCFFCKVISGITFIIFTCHLRNNNIIMGCECKMSVSSFNSTNLDGALKAAAYLKAKSEVTGGKGHFGKLSSGQKNATFEKMQAILTSISTNPMAKWMLLKNHLENREVKSSTANDFLKSHGFIRGAKGHEKIDQEKIKQTIGTIGQISPNNDAKRYLETFEKVEGQANRSQERLDGVKRSLQGKPTAKAKKLCDQAERLISLQKSKFKEMLNALEKGDSTQMKNIMDSMKKISEQINSSINLVIPAQKLEERERMIETNPESAYQDALKHLNLNNKKYRASEANVSNDYYMHEDAARHMVEAALAIANKLPESRTTGERKILHDLKLYMTPEFHKKDGPGTPRMAAGYINLYREAISQAFRTTAGKELEKKLEARFDHSPTYEVRDPDLHRRGVDRLSWPTPDNPIGLPTGQAKLS